MVRPAVALTGYLAQVVERVLPTQPTLQRRQPALFEPAQPGSGARLQDAVDEPVAAPARMGGHARVPPASTPRAARVEVSAPLPAQAPPPDARAVASDAAILAPVAPRGVTPAVVTPPLAVPREPPLVDTTVRVVTVNLPPRAEPVRAAGQAVVAVPAAATPRPDAPRVTEQPPMARRASPPAAEGTPDRTRRSVAPRADAPPAPRRQRHAEAAPPMARRPRPPVPAVMPSRATMRAAAQSAARPVAPAPARELPPVEVTIGRVEVRAVAAAPSNPHSQRATPRMSLDQYLSDRTGGSR